MPLSAAQRANLQVAKLVVGGANGGFTLYGRLGAFIQFNWDGKVDDGDFSTKERTIAVSKAGGSRARYLGDTNRTPVPAVSYSYKRYPSGRQNLMPGDPIEFTAVSETYADSDDLISATFSVLGSMTDFFTWLDLTRPPFDCRLKGHGGSTYDGIIYAVKPGPSGGGGGGGGG